MLRYPEILQPTEFERITLPDESTVQIPKATPRFRRWRGMPPGGTYGGKTVLDVNGEPVFAELGILRAFQRDGWDGVWVDTYRRRYRVVFWGDPEGVKPPREQQEFLDAIHSRAGTRSGCWDVFCWKHEFRLFAEAKRVGKDASRERQIKWLAAALELGVPVFSFLIVEWSVEKRKQAC